MRFTYCVIPRDWDWTAISEPVLSDSKDLRRHFRVVPCS
jgi:hypothetical protein